MTQDPNLPPSQPSSSLPPLPAPAPARPRPRSGLTAYAIVLTVLFVCCLAALGFLLAMNFVGGSLKAAPLAKVMHKRAYQEAVIGGDEWSDNKIAVIYLQGLISYEPMTDYFGRSASSEMEGMVGEIKAQLKQAREDKNVKAVLIRMDTPGGEVTAADDLYHEVLKFKEAKPVVVSMSSLAASGGYYIAAAANHIVASETTLTGSVGVVISMLTFEETLKKIGIKPVVFKSGKFKDILSPMREPTPDEAKLLQNLVMEDYDRFLDIVARGRIKAVQKDATESDIVLLKDKLRNGLADGRILTGKQAKEGDLVDTLGYFEDAVTETKKIAGVKDARLIQYYRQISLADLFGLGANASKEPMKVEFSLVGAQKLRLEPGKRYYLHEGYALP